MLDLTSFVVNMPKLIDTWVLQVKLHSLYVCVCVCHVIAATSEHHFQQQGFALLAVARDLAVISCFSG